MYATFLFFFYISIFLCPAIMAKQKILTPRHLAHHEITITKINTRGEIVTKTLTPEQFTTYQNMPIQPFHPEKEGGFTTLQSVSDLSWYFPVHFQASETTSLQEKPLSERAIVITLPGLGGRASDIGPFATALRSCADILALGTTLDKYPFQQKKPDNNYRQGSLAACIADERTKQLGGAFRRTAEEPIADIIHLLSAGVTVRFPDGTTRHVRPYDYGKIIVVGLCIANTTFIQAQEQLIMSNKRGFDGFIMESPLADFQSPVPAKWIRNLSEFGQATSILPTLKQLYAMGKAAPTYILRGGQDDLCTLASVLAVLHLSDHAHSMITTTVPAGHTRSMYNDNYDKNDTKKKIPWQKIYGSRQAHTGILQEWFKENFLEK